MLTWTRTSEGVVALRGEIDEKSVFDPLVHELKDGGALDLSGVDRINSVGVRSWLTFVQALDGNGKRVSLLACSVPVVHQLNMISRFAGDAKVASIHAPFLCPECESSSTRLVDTTNADVDAQLSAGVACPKCGAAMEFDDVPASYFAFLRQRR